MYDKLISIVLPTFNRKEYLKLTLDCFLDQVNRNANDISFCVCNNASTDGTDSFLEKYNLKNKMSVLLILQNMLMSDIVYPEQMI